MGKTRVTSKFQITLPADVRERVPFRVGETVEVEVEDDRTVRVRKTRRVIKDPLKYLVSKKPLLRKPIPQEEIDELAEP